MNIQKIVLGICLCYVTPGFAQSGVIAQTKRIKVVSQPVERIVLSKKNYLYILKENQLINLQNKS